MDDSEMFGRPCRGFFRTCRPAARSRPSHGERDSSSSPTEMTPPASVRFSGSFGRLHWSLIHPTGKWQPLPAGNAFRRTTFVDAGGVPLLGCSVVSERNL